MLQKKTPFVAQKLQGSHSDPPHGSEVFHDFPEEI
jgi:hypothetical protein